MSMARWSCIDSSQAGTRSGIICLIRSWIKIIQLIDTNSVLLVTIHSALEFTKRAVFLLCTGYSRIGLSIFSSTRRVINPKFSFKKCMIDPS